MDDLDRQLIAALRHNGRASLSELAATLGASRTTVRARMERMQRDGVIVGYSVVLKEDVIDAPVRGLMMIEIAGLGTEKILRTLTGMPEIRGVHSTNGRWDVIVEIAVNDLEDFDQVLNDVRRIDGITASETSLLLTTKKRA
jgi:DNA-binding Lrp family transcriptional regulator